MSDLLNDHDEFELIDVQVEILVRDRIIEVRALEQARGPPLKDFTGSLMGADRRGG